MGGIGSGRHGKRSEKVLVEETRRLKISSFRGLLEECPEKQVVFRFGTRNPFLVFANVLLLDGKQFLVLRYIPKSYGQEMVELEVEVVQGNNGLKCYFRCPLDSDGCLGRVSSLHLPLRTPNFGCRKCHDLTYRSSQTAHYAERFSKKLRVLFEMGNLKNRDE